MRKLTALTVLCLATSALAHDHATHDHEAMLREFIATNSVHGPVLQASQIAPTGVTRTFNITAKQFEFIIDPSPFEVNQGDTVVLNVSVPGIDGSNVGHGILMETYIENGQLNQVLKGKSKSFEFVATTVGQFIFVCTQSACDNGGGGHSNMFGTFKVKPAQAVAPTITSMFPVTGSTAGGTTVIITGANFGSGATVTFGGTAATNVNVTSSTSITATTPAHAAGAVDVKVTNTDNQSVTALGAFTYVAPAVTTVVGVLPGTAPLAGGTSITINGANLPTTGTATVTVGGTAATDVKLQTTGFLTATLPAHAAGTVDVVVSVGGQNFTLTSAVTYVANTPKKRAARH